MTTGLAKLFLHRSWIVTGELGGAGVETEECEGGLAGDEELSWDGRMNTDAGEQFSRLETH